jgi:hypothetical protein
MGDGGRARAEVGLDLGSGAGGALRVRTVAGVEGVAVEDELVDAVEDRVELLERAEAGGAVAVV